MEIGPENDCPLERGGSSLPLFCNFRRVHQSRVTLGISTDTKNYRFIPDLQPMMITHIQSQKNKLHGPIAMLWTSHSDITNLMSRLSVCMYGPDVASILSEAEETHWKILVATAKKFNYNICTVRKVCACERFHLLFIPFLRYFCFSRTKQSTSV